MLDIKRLSILFCERQQAEHAKACSFFLLFLDCLLIAKLPYCKILNRCAYYFNYIVTLNKMMPMSNHRKHPAFRNI